jgi:SHS2 domain-containing protein
MPSRSRNERAGAYEYLSHTADLRVRVEARNLEALHGAMVRAFRDIVVGDSPRRDGPPVTMTFSPAGTDEAERFFRFVRELVFVNDADGLVPIALVPSSRPGALAVEFEPFTPGTHASMHGVKAATRHGYRFEHGPSGYLAEIIFDL